MTSLDKLTDPATGKPAASAFDEYFYDTTSGMLFFYVMQDRPNAKGTSPLGSCKGDASDPSFCPKPNAAADKDKESYYACPPEGCVTYTVLLNDMAYDPGAVEVREVRPIPWRFMRRSPPTRSRRPRASTTLCIWFRRARSHPPTARRNAAPEFRDRDRRGCGDDVPAPDGSVSGRHQHESRMSADRAAAFVQLR